MRAPDRLGGVVVGGSAAVGTGARSGPAGAFAPDPSAPADPSAFRVLTPAAQTFAGFLRDSAAAGTAS
ncbi:hypothetical protein C3492_27145 [Streptomyces sp. Ru62]|uniref:hypothetical protein n=1 Tax=Streptomyces sp. Ru62 TaxID=2080745 RepID=UPI000CDE4D1A|nr:hypothetical protein [Streptomyces sp. Ru62]POX60419.1 hypothetical protein C3492_27145 [Streptomyces sp. Ru62]